VGDDARAYDELCAYTLTRGDAGFVHQHVVDAWMAQHADDTTRPIGVAFALVGLYLHVERGLTGRQVQRVHMALARPGRDWPAFPPPPERGSFTARHVMAAPAGPARDRAIDEWCASVWEAWHDRRESVIALLEEHGFV